MKTVIVRNNSKPLPASLQAIYCDGFFCRLRGLMFRSRLASGSGLLLVERGESRIDTSIHMLFVGMDLGVVWINSSFQVVDLLLARSWHLAYLPKRAARFTLEINPARLSEFSVGDTLEFIDA